MFRILAGLGLAAGLLLGEPLVFQPAAAAELEQIEQRGYLIVAVKDNWRPLGFRDEAGELAGLEIDIAKALAAELLGDAEAVELRSVSNVDRLSVVIEGEVDIAIAGVTLTEARSRLVSFSIPYYLDGTAVITRNPLIQRSEDLNDRRIAVLENSSAIALVRYLFPSATLVGASTYTQALSTLEADQADAFAADASVLTGWVQEYPRYRQLPALVSAEPLAVVIPKGTRFSPLRRQINRHLQDWIDDGWLAERTDYWGLP